MIQKSECMQLFGTEHIMHVQQFIQESQATGAAGKQAYGDRGCLNSIRCGIALEVS
jgi:hypothetical protein